MKNIAQISLATGLILAALSLANDVSAQQTNIGKITFAGDATITNDSITFADNAAILSSTFFSGGTDSNGNPLPDLELNGPVTVSPITLATFGSTGGGIPVSFTSPLIDDNIKFFPHPVEGFNGINLDNPNRFVGGTFSGYWVTGRYKFPGQIDFSAQGLPGNQSFSISGIATGDSATLIPEPMTILGTGFILAALPKLKKAYQKKA
jgi:hypothetical protein